MKSVEEKLWDYIDGSGNAEEQQAIKNLIETDAIYSSKYQELVQLNQEFAAMELDEPPMAFTYNVMEAIRKEHAQQPLKAAINPYIIKGLATFFILIVVGVLVVLFSSINWTGGNVTSNFALPNFATYFNSRVLNAFLFFDTLLGLFFLDAYLRKRNFSKQA